MSMPLEYVLVTVIQCIVMILMAVMLLRCSREMASMARHTDLLIRINRLQERLIDILMARLDGKESGSDDPREGYR